MYILEKENKIKSLNFAKSNAHRKTNKHDSFETLFVFFVFWFSLTGLFSI